MNRQTLITMLTRNPVFRGRCIRLSDNPDDLLQDSYLVLLKMDEERMIKLQSEGDLERYFMGVIYFTHLHTKKYAVPAEASEYLHSEDGYDDSSDKIIDRYLDVLNSGLLDNVTEAERPDFAQILLDEYLEEGSMSKLARELGVYPNMIKRILKPIINKMKL